MARPLRIGIVGCGVAGLASAVALARLGHRVTLIERAPRSARSAPGCSSSLRANSSSADSGCWKR